MNYVNYPKTIILEFVLLVLYFHVCVVPIDREVMYAFNSHLIRITSFIFLIVTYMCLGTIATFFQSIIYGYYIQRVIDIDRTCRKSFQLLQLTYTNCLRCP